MSLRGAGGDEVIYGVETAMDCPVLPRFARSFASLGTRNDKLTFVLVEFDIGSNWNLAPHP